MLCHAVLFLHELKSKRIKTYLGSKRLSNEWIIFVTQADGYSQGVNSVISCVCSWLTLCLCLHVLEPASANTDGPARQRHVNHPITIFTKLNGECDQHLATVVLHSPHMGAKRVQVSFAQLVPPLLHRQCAGPQWPGSAGTSIAAQRSVQSRPTGGFVQCGGHWPVPHSWDHMPRRAHGCATQRQCGHDQSPAAAAAAVWNGGKSLFIFVCTVSAGHGRGPRWTSRASLL